MPSRSSILALSAVLSLAAGPALAAPVFNRIASFPTTANLPDGADATQETSAEIMAATEDGNTLIYSDSPLGALGLVDITDPAEPKALGSIAMDGEPTTTVVIGGTAFVGVNTSPSLAEPSGALRMVDIAARTVTASCDLGGQPDAVARNAAGTLVAVAIENERDEDVADGALPQMPAGYVVTIPVRDGAADCAGLRTIDLTGLAEVAGDDPEPEYLAFNGQDELVVTLQENNHLVVIGADGAVAADFSAGSVDLTGIDTAKDGRIDATGEAKAVAPEPDAVAWLDDDHFVTANEGDWKGGSRGFTVWKKDGTVVYESGNLLDRALMRLGHYPDHRNKKGGEPEAVIAAAYDGKPMFFVASERGSIVFAFDATDPAQPELVQALPSGLGPEGLVALPQRGLFATANETDLGEDGGPRAHVMIYRREEGVAAYPTLTAGEGLGEAGWGALSGLTVDPGKPGVLHAVSDSAYDGAPAIFTIDAAATPATITGRTLVTRDGAPAAGLDLEGIAADGEGGFWLASEGDPEKEIANAVLHVGADGAIDQEIALPETLTAGATRFGLEGIAVDESGLWLAVQREWKDDPKGHVKLLRLDPATGDWTGLHYPVATGEGWVGLSEIAVHDGSLYLVERDNLVGERAALKRITRVDLAAAQPTPLDGTLPVVTGEVVRDLIPDLKRWNGYVVDKVEGMAIAADGTVHVVTDNDGVDDSSGETFLWSFALK